MNNETRHLVAELERLRADLLAMGRLAEDRLKEAMHGLIHRKADALRAVVDGDPRTANRDLEASWSLNVWLRREPVLIDQWIAIAMAPMGG